MKFVLFSMPSLSRLVGMVLTTFFVGDGVCSQYVMTKSTFSTAGGSASSANYVLKSAAGQSVTGESNSSSRIEQAGFYTYSTVQEVGIQEQRTQLVPNVFSLFQPRPNPMAKSATIKYGVPRMSQISIRVFDVTGRVVRTLVDCDKKPGFYTIKWDGELDNGTRVAQGIYFIRMLAQDFKATKKLVLLK